MELLKAATVSLVLWVANKVTKHVTYPIQVGRNIRALESALRELGALKEDVKATVMNAERESGVPTERVKLWLDDVEAIEQKASEICEKYRQLWRCIWDFSPAFWSNYKISKRAEKAHDEVTRLCEKKTTFEVIVHTPPPLAIKVPVSSSNSSNLKLALDHIMDDVHSTIGIWGMGGVGKTHLLREINNEISNDSTFSVVILVTSSKEGSEEKIQNEIIDKLGLNRYDTMEGRQSSIFNFLKQKSFVLLLDDLWNRINLETVGIPTPYGRVGNCMRKVVLTTRSEDVCNLMDVEKKMRVNVLDWNGSWSLFKGRVSEETIESHPLVLKYAIDVVKELGGLPLALITVGRAMHGRADPNEWELAVQLLKQARLHDVELSGTDEPVFKVLKFSYDKLKNDNLRECFLHCSLWPEDYPIEKNDLVELWMGLGLIDEHDIHMAYNVGYNYISRLLAVCLLESTNNESQVKLHDVIRDMSLWIISKEGLEKNKWVVRSGASKSSKELVVHSETEKMSLMHYQGNLSFSSSCSNARITTLLFTCSWLYDVKNLRHPSFSKLTVLNLRNNRFIEFPVDVCKLITLQFIDLPYNNIMSLPSQLRYLVNLKFLLLKGNMICTIPVEAISNMKTLHMLDLTPPYHLAKKTNRGKLNYVSSLLEELQGHPDFKALGIEINDMMQFQRLSKSSNVPVRWLTVTICEKLSTFSIPSWFLESFQSRSNLFSLSITNMEVERLNFESTSGNPSSCELGRLEDIFIFDVHMKEIVWKGLEPKDVLPRLKCLTIWWCRCLKSIPWVAHLPCLQELQVSYCHSIKQLIHGNEFGEKTFPVLKLLELNGLGELESICDFDITFPALETLKIHDTCEKLKKLPFRTNDIPPKLKSIWVHKKWWNNIEWDESSLKSSLCPFVKFLH